MLHKNILERPEIILRLQSPGWGILCVAAAVVATAIVMPLTHPAALMNNRADEDVFELQARQAWTDTGWEELQTSPRFRTTASSALLRTSQRALGRRALIQNSKSDENSIPVYRRQIRTAPAGEVVRTSTDNDGFNVTIDNDSEPDGPDQPPLEFTLTGELLGVDFIGEAADTLEFEHAVSGEELLARAEAVLQKTFWDRLPFEVKEVQTDGMLMVGFELSEPYNAHFVDLEMIFDGRLRVLQLKDEWRPADENLAEASGWYQAPGVVSFIAGSLFTIVLFLRRFSLRIIDHNKAFRAGLAWAFIAAAPTVLAAINLFIYPSDFSWMNLLGFGGMLIVLFLIGGLAAFFMIGVAHSISHEVWPEKLTASSLVTDGYWINKPVGESFYNSLCPALGLVLLVLASLLLFNSTPVSFASGLAGSVFDFGLFSLLGEIAGQAYLALYIVSIFFLGILAQVQKQKQKRFKTIAHLAAILLIGGVCIGLIPLTEGWERIAAGFAAGFFLYLLFRHSRQISGISLIMALVLASSILNGGIAFAANGWNDFSLVICWFAIPLAILYVAESGMRSKLRIHELPDLTPAYILERTERERMERELEIARQVQQTFLPSDTPEIPNVLIDANCSPAWEVGGDYYDFIPLPDGRIAIVIADVSGKGTLAAFFMTLTKGFLRSTCTISSDPADILRRVNRLFVDSQNGGNANAGGTTFVTMLLGILDTEKRTFEFARAGHEPLLHLQAASEKIQTLKPDGLAIGMVKDGRFDTVLKKETVHLAPGDCLVLYTDGYTEAHNYKKQIYGSDRLYAFIRQHRHRSPAQLIQLLNAEINRFSAGRARHDDMTLIAVKLDR